MNDKEIKQLANKISEEIGTSNIEDDIDFIEIDNAKYGFTLIEELTTEDDSKFQYGGNIYKAGILNQEEGYGIIGEPLFYLEQDFVRTGSYYSDYYYEYDEPYPVEQKEIITKVWKKID